MPARPSLRSCPATARSSTRRTPPRSVSRETRPRPADRSPGTCAGCAPPTPPGHPAPAEVLAQHSEGGPPDEPRLAWSVARALPAGALLFVASSMPVRDVDAFAGALPGVRILARRGVNGIDGMV